MRRFLIVILMIVLSLSLVACSGSSDTDATADDDVMAGLPDLEDGAVRVVLSWDEAVDMDLEIWDDDGMNFITSASAQNEDILDGADGSEYFDFTGDYANGTYVVSVYFAGGGDVADRARTTVTVVDADGETVSRNRTIDWEIGLDQWHAFSIDAASGDITDIDEIIETGTD